jgi:hypothetical protein
VQSPTEVVIPSSDNWGMEGYDIIGDITDDGLSAVIAASAHYAVQ